MDREFTHITIKNTNVTANFCPSSASEAEFFEVVRVKHFVNQGAKLIQEDMDIRMNAVRRKILVLSGKGGVGKSSVASSLAVTLAQRGKTVGLLDLDLCGPSIPTLMRVKSTEIVESPYGWIPLESEEFGIKVMSVQYMLDEPDLPVVWRGPRKTALIKRFIKDTFWGRLDYLIVDTPPGTSDEHLTVIGALRNSRPDGAVVVTTPHSLSLSTVRKEINFCAKMGIRILGVLENMSGFACPCCGEVTNVFSEGGGESIAKEYSIPFLGRIPLDPRVAASGDSGLSLLKQFPDSPCPDAFSRALDQLLKALQ